MFTQITKKRVKELEVTTTPYMNRFYNSPEDCEEMTDEHKDRLRHNSHEFHNWYNEDFDLMYSSLYKCVDYISRKIGFKQNYYVSYWQRNAVWGFMWEDHECILYYSNRGLSLQVPKNMKQLKVIELLGEIINCWRS